MAALAMTPKFLNRISNEKYLEEDSWKIDDIALGPANELLISGHNLEIPKTFISMYKEDSGKYGNRPEFNRNFRHPQPGEQLVLFLEGSLIIGLKVESALRLVSIGDMGVLKTLNWKWSPTCVCFYRGKLYAASSSSTIVSVCNLDSEEKSDIFLSDMRSDSVLDIVVVMEKIYVCTKFAGRALVFSMTGSKEIEFKNPVQTDAMATCICIHERTDLVFVLWNNIQIQLYSQTSRCLLAFDMTEKLHKIRVTTENILVTLSASKCIVSVYDVGEAIKFGEFQNTILSSLKKKNPKKLMSHDVENLEIHPADFETFSFHRKSASKQSKVENLRDTKELYMKQLEENENLGRQYDRDVQKTRTEKDDLRRMNGEKEEKLCSLTNQLEAERKTTEEGEITKDTVTVSTEIMKTGVRGLIDGINDDTVELTKKKDDVTEKLEITKLMKEEVDCAQIPVELDALKEGTKAQEGMTKETKSRQKTDYLDHEKGQGICKERAHAHVPKYMAVTNLKKVEERNTKIKEHTLKETLLAEKKKAEEVQTCYQNLHERIRELKRMKTDLESQLLLLKDNLFQEKEKVVTNLTKVEEMNTKLEKEVKQLHERLLAEENTAKEVQTTSVKLHERIRELECKKTELESQQKLLKDNLVKEKEKLNEKIRELACTKAKLESQQKELKEKLEQEKKEAKREEMLRTQVLIHLKRVEERNNKLEKGVEKLQNKLSDEERKAEELETSSQKLHERIRELECMKTELESLQKLLKDKLDQDKGNAQRELASRMKADTEIEKLQHEKKQLEKEKDSLQRQQQQLRNEIKKEKQLSEINKQDITRAEDARKTLEQTKAMLEKEKEYLNKLLAAEDRNETELKKSLEKATTTCEKLQEANEVLQREKEDLSEQLSTEKTNKEIQIASFSKMTSHASPGSEKMAQRKDEDSYLCDETQSVITESTDSGRGSMHSGLEYHDPFILNGRQLKTELKVAVTVTYRGANMHIPDTGVALDIPAGAVGGKVLIEMIILPFDKLDAPVSTFSCNSSVAVELLPNRMEFHRPVRLILPNCLKLTKNYKKTKNQVQVYVSHHETGPPIWEEVSNAEYVLNETNCVIFVKSFCWVKYEVNNKIVEAKRIRAYTAGKRLKYTEDSLAEIEVGYHWDLPNARENLSISDNMFVYQSKPFIYVKDGNLPLEIFLTKSVPKQWKYITPTENPKVITFKCVADSKEKSCPFVIEKSEPTDRMPFCMFKVQQGNEDLELYIRFDD